MNDERQRPTVNALRAVIRVQTPPEYDPRTGMIRPGRLIGFDTGDQMDIGRDLLAVTTSKKLSDAAGRFTLTLAPRQVERSSTWADLIPPYSLVEVYLQSYPSNPEPVLVMLGLTDTNQISEDFSEAAPQRQVQIAGRELSAIFVDQKTLYLPVPPDKLSPEVAPQLFRYSDGRTGPGGRTDIPHSRSVRLQRRGDEQADLPATATQAYALFGLLAIDPELATIGSSPVEVIDRFVRMCTVGLRTEYNPSGRPLLNFEFPDAQLRDLLFFDRAKAKAALFDRNAMLPAAAQLVGDGHALWNLMTTFSDPTYQELFAQSRDVTEISTNTIASTSLLPAVEVVFRKKPFAGRIGAGGEVEGVAPVEGSQFDAAFLASDSIDLVEEDLISSSLARSGLGVRNLYLVYPQFQNINEQVDYRSTQAPLLDAHPLSPASAFRYGPRLMTVADYYLHMQETPGSGRLPATAFEIGKHRQQLLWAWHRFAPLFWQGTSVLRGMPRLRVGMRIREKRRRFSREFYCTAVTHSLTLGRQQTRFVTQAALERGWPLPEDAR